MTKEKILVVDDDKLVLATLCSGLKRAGYTVASASGGKSAIEQLENSRFDLVILDVRMPDISGVDVSTRLKSEGIPFIVLSAYSDRDGVELLIDNGALSYLIKPIDVQNLIPAIEAALHRADDIHRCRTNEKNLQFALEGEQSASKAIGILMERHKLSSEAAFELLRTYARSQRRKLAEVAGELVVASNTLNDVVDKRAPGKR